METQQASLKVTAARFLRSVRILLRSEVGGRAKLMFAGLVALLFGLNGLNVVNNYVGRIDGAADSSYRDRWIGRLLPDLTRFLSAPDRLRHARRRHPGRLPHHHAHHRHH